VFLLRAARHLTRNVQKIDMSTYSFKECAQ
jgi:hypothetical protein